MSFLRTLNKKLNKMFDGQVTAHEDSGCLVLSGELQRWSDVVLAGRLAVDKNSYFGLVNDIKCTGEPAVPVRKPRLEDGSLEWEEPDVLIIGGGIIGCSIARELSRYKLNVLLVEKEHDLAMQASGRNVAIVHSWNGLKKGTLRQKYTNLGNHMYDETCAELGVDFYRSGQYVCFAKRFWDPFMFLQVLYWKWQGIKGVKAIKRDRLHTQEPAINKDIGAALFFPDTGVVNPFDLTIAYAENAAKNGVEISFDTIVQEIVTEEGRIKSVKTNRGTILPKVVVNAAGVFSDNIAAMAGDRFFSIRPKKGTIAVLDKKYTSSLVQTVVSTPEITSAHRRRVKGGNVVHTADGNTLVGPDIVETAHREDFTTSLQVIKELFAARRRIVPKLDEQQIIAYYSGIEAATYDDDYIVCKGKYVANIVHAAGIQTPGLTAAPAISADVAQMVLELFGGENEIGLNPDFDPLRAAPPRPSHMDDAERSELIETNPDYGIIVCRCEDVSRGEILNALRRSVPCDTVDGVKRRIRPGMGCCHGGFCQPQVLEIIAAEKRITPQNVKKSGIGSEKLFGSAKSMMSKTRRRGSPAASTKRKEKLDPEIEMGLLARANAAQSLRTKREDIDSDGDE